MASITLKHRILILFSVVTLQLQAQYILDTPDGKKVELNKNGTWKYLKQESNKNTKQYIPNGSNAIYTSLYRKFAIYYDPNDWNCDSSKNLQTISWDATFSSKDYAVQAFCLDSRLSMPFSSVEGRLRQQWQPLGEIRSMKVVEDTLNDIPFSKFEMILYTAGIEYKYEGYIYSSPRGSFQIYVGTQKEIFEEDKAKIDKLFKGMIKL